jgi:hypothetical protein
MDEVLSGYEGGQFDSAVGQFPRVLDRASGLRSMAPRVQDREDRAGAPRTRASDMARRAEVWLIVEARAYHVGSGCLPHAAHDVALGIFDKASASHQKEAISW